MSNLNQLILSTQNPSSIYDLTQTELRQLSESLGELSYRGSQVFDWLYAGRVEDFDSMANIPKSLRNTLNEKYIFSPLTLDKTQQSSDGSVKFLFSLLGGGKIESVYIPSKDPVAEPRHTLCISTQSGCALDCAFCSTGKMGFSRNLTPGEIVGQALAAEKLLSLKLSNIVFMGMGEPLMNFDNLIRSLEILTDEKAALFSGKRITVSTSGIVPKIYALAVAYRENPGIRTKLALSLHSATDDFRQKIMPIAKKWNISSLGDALEYFYRNVNIPITFEYILLRDLTNGETNFSEVHLKKLIRLARRVPTKINLIPFNDITYNPEGKEHLAPAGAEETEAFASALRKEGIPAIVRQPYGRDIAAACGQLALQEK